MALAMESPPSWDTSRQWRQAAACRDLDTNLFFPAGLTGEAVEQVAAARRICAGCPVAKECLAFAITTNQEFGVWGGMSEEERRALRREWRAQVRARTAS